MSAKFFLSSACAVVLVCALVAGCGSDSSSPTSVEAPILPPQNVVTKQLPTGGVLISWDANSQSNLRGYNVYRLEMGSSILKLTAEPTKATQHTDLEVEMNHSYEYRVTSVSTRGDESAVTVSHIQLTDARPGDVKTRRGDE